MRIMGCGVYWLGQLSMQINILLSVRDRGKSEIAQGIQLIAGRNVKECNHPWNRAVLDGNIITMRVTNIV